MLTVEDARDPRTKIGFRCVLFSPWTTDCFVKQVVCTVYSVDCCVYCKTVDKISCTLRSIHFFLTTSMFCPGFGFFRQLPRGGKTWTKRAPADWDPIETLTHLDDHDVYIGVSCDGLSQVVVPSVYTEDSCWKGGQESRSWSSGEIYSRGSETACGY